MQVQVERAVYKAVRDVTTHNQGVQGEVRLMFLQAAKMAVQAVDFFLWGTCFRGRCNAGGCLWFGLANSANVCASEGGR